MSMIENFLDAKEGLREALEEVKEEMLKEATVRADKLIDDFIDWVKEEVAGASDAEFVEFITSGKLSDEDLNAAIMFRAQSNVSKKPEVKSEPCGEQNVPNKKPEPIHVFVLEI